MDNSGADFGAMDVGNGTLVSSFNVSSDFSLDSSVASNFENRPASGVFVNPSTQIHPVSGVVGVFKLSGPSIVATSGFSYQDRIASPSGSAFYRHSRNTDDNNSWMFRDKSGQNLGFNFDIAGTARSSGNWHVGAFQYSDYKPTKTVTLFINPSGFIPHTNRSNFLFTEGAALSSSSLNLYTKSNNPIEKSFSLFLDSSLFSETRTLFVTGKDITSEDEDSSQFLSLGMSGGGGGSDSGGGTGSSTRQSSSINLFITTSFPATGLSPIRKKRLNMSIVGVSEMIPNGFGLNNKTGQYFNGYNRSPSTESKGFIPFSESRTLFCKTEPSTINQTDHHYRFEPNEGGGLNDAAGSLNFSSEAGASPIFIDDLNSYSLNPKEPNANIINVGLINTSQIQATNIANGTTFGHLFHNHNEDFSSDGGIAVSFWIKRFGYQTLENPTISQTGLFLTPEQPSKESGYLETSYFLEESEFDENPEGVLTKGSLHFNSEGNYKFFEGDWGIFKRAATSSREKDLSFYVNVLDSSKEDSIINEGFNLDTGSWYYIMYWIDAVGKESYVKYRKQSDYTGANSVILPLQKWKTRLLSNLQNETVSGYSSLLAAQTTGHKFYLGHNSFSGKNLGESYGDVWGFDEVKTSKKVGSYFAMSQAFDSQFESYLPEYYKSGNKTMFISGIDDD